MIILPNFFIVGAPKAGTTSLYAMLKKHPEVFMSNPKEVNFFSASELSDQKIYYDPYLVDTREDYLHLFENAKEFAAIGESSVSYLFYDKVPQRIYDFNPQSKIIISLRNPIDRAYSHYLMDRKLGFVKKSFEDIAADALLGKKDIYVQQYFELGKYFHQVGRYLEVFGKEQVCVIFFSQIEHSLSSVFDRLCDFLAVDRVNLEEGIEENTFQNPRGRIVESLYAKERLRKISKRVLPGKLRTLVKNGLFKPGAKPELSDDLIHALKSYYAEDMKLLTRLLSIDEKKIDFS